MLCPVHSTPHAFHTAGVPGGEKDLEDVFIAYMFRNVQKRIHQVTISLLINLKDNRSFFMSLSASFAMSQNRGWVYWSFAFGAL